MAVISKSSLLLVRLFGVFEQIKAQYEILTSNKNCFALFFQAFAILMSTALKTILRHEVFSRNREQTCPLHVSISSIRPMS